MSQPVGFFAGFQQGLQLAGTGRSHVQHQPIAHGRDLRHFVGVICHDGGSAACQKNIGAIIGCHMIVDAMDERFFLPDPGNDFT